MNKKEDTLNSTIISQIRQVNDSITNVKFTIVDQRKRVDVHDFQIAELEKAKKLRDRSSSAEKEKKVAEQAKVVVPANADTQKHSNLGLMTAMQQAGIFETKFTEMQKTIKKLREEFIPKRIERAIENLQEKIKLGQMKSTQT